MDCDRWRKIGIFILIMIISLVLWSCKGSESANVEKVPDGKPAAAEKIENNKENTSEASIEKEITGKTQTTSTNKLVTAQAKVDTAKTHGEYSITIKGSGVKEETIFTESDLKKLEIKSYTYSFRNKEKNNERQFVNLTGVPMYSLLEKAGWNGSSDIVGIACSDGYSSRYKISEINGFFTYQKESGEVREPIPAMLAILEDGDYLGNEKYYHYSEGAPFRLVYGQEDYDSDFTKDFNMQGWGYYVTDIIID